MKIVIDISDNLMEYIVKGRDLSEEQNDEMALAIANGTPLPEHHGRLIDADELYGDFIDGTEGYDCNTWNRIEIGDIIEDAPTIIEAECTYKETGCGSYKRQLDCPIEADKGVLEKINEKQDSLRTTCKAWDEAISRDGYVD